VPAGLLRLVTVDRHGQATRRRVRLDTLPEPVRAELTPFVTRRLLAIDRNPAGAPATVEVTHERLAADPATAVGPMSAVLSRADLAVVNLETSVTTGGVPRQRRRLSCSLPRTMRDAVVGGVVAQRLS
jgi:hypothetical protein